MAKPNKYYTKKNKLPLLHKVEVNVDTPTFELLHKYSQSNKLTISETGRKAFATLLSAWSFNTGDEPELV